MKFKDKWYDAVEKKGSVLCAGLDPAEFDMGRGEKGLPEGLDKRDWTMDYLEAVAPSCAAVKPNLQYWVGDGYDMDTLEDVFIRSKDLGMVVISDSKLADIGSTNDAGIYNTLHRADAVTVAPYAGNMAEIGKQAKNRGIGAITMCLMSNPEYAREKNMLVPLTESESAQFREMDLVSISGVNHVQRYKYLANGAKQYGLDGIVIGAPSDKNHLTEGELENARMYVGGDILVLLPGLGHQGGEAEMIWKYFNKENVIANVGRSLMFPNGSNSTPDEQAKTAKYYMEMLNKLR
ncbi:MAG: orotidine 5'-phosphate decarboxylase / HUMPS family protein [archaeon]